VRIFSLLSLVILASFAARAGEAPDVMEQEKKHLMKLSGYVGEWKGTGSTKESAGRDAWTEDSDWGWDFKGGKSAIVFTTKGGRYFSDGRITSAGKEGSYIFTGTALDTKAPEEFRGELKDGELVMDAVKPGSANRPARLNMSLVAKGKRLVIQYLRSPRKDRFEPLSEIGLTLKGSGFGKNFTMNECCITGGSGKISVSYKGATYYVCCGGCKDAFDANPDKEIAAFLKRKEEEKKAMNAK